MKRLALAFALALAVSLTLLAGAAGAHHRHHGVFVGCCVFIGPVSPFVHHHFFNNGFIDPLRAHRHSGEPSGRDGTPAGLDTRLLAVDRLSVDLDAGPLGNS